MINILLEDFNIQAPWLHKHLKSSLPPHHSVAVMALAFNGNRIRSLADWNARYHEEYGSYYPGIIAGFAAYGIPKTQVSFVNYFTDTKETAAQKIREADIIYFLGGLPDRMMQRIFTQATVDWRQTLWQQTGARVSPGTDFGFGGEGFFRLNITCPQKQVATALSHLKLFVRTNSG